VDAIKDTLTLLEQLADTHDMALHGSGVNLLFGAAGTNGGERKPLFLLVTLWRRRRGPITVPAESATDSVKRLLHACDLDSCGTRGRRNRVRGPYRCVGAANSFGFVSFGASFFRTL
jgi:hypothetical protein